MKILSMISILLGSVLVFAGYVVSTTNGYDSISQYFHSSDNLDAIGIFVIIAGIFQLVSGAIFLLKSGGGRNRSLHPR